MNRNLFAFLGFTAAFVTPILAEDLDASGRRLATSYREDAQSIGGEVYKFSIPNHSSRFSVVLREKLSVDANWREIFSHDFGRHHDGDTYDLLISFVCGKTFKEGYPAKNEEQMNLSLRYQSGKSTHSDTRSEGFWTAIDRPFGNSAEWPFEVQCAAIGEEITRLSKQTLSLIRMNPRNTENMDIDKFAPVAEICVVFREAERTQAEQKVDEALFQSVAYLSSSGSVFAGSNAAFSSDFREGDVDRVYLNEGSVGESTVTMLRRFTKLKHIAVGPKIQNLPLDSPIPVLSDVASREKRTLQLAFPNVIVELEDLSGQKSWKIDSSGKLVPVSL